MGRHNGLWVPAHEGAIEHEKTLKAARVLTAKLGVEPEYACHVVFTATLRLEQHALKQGESGIIGFMADGQVGSIGWPEKSWAAGKRRRVAPDEVGKALRAALHAGGQLEGEGAAERVHDFRDHCRHIVADRERKRVRRPQDGEPTKGALPRTDEPDHVVDSVGASRGIPSKAPPKPASKPIARMDPEILVGPSADPQRNGHGASGERKNGKAPSVPPATAEAKSELGAEFHRVCSGRRDACEIASAEALLSVPAAWALAWAQRQVPGSHRGCFEMRRRMEEAFADEHPEHGKAPRRGSVAMLRLEDDPGWSPATWPRNGESAPDYAARAGITMREAKAGIVVAGRRGGFARVPASG